MSIKKILGVASFNFALALVLIPIEVSAGLPSARIFADNSFWYQEIPTKVTLHENSKGFVTDFLRQKSAHYGNVNINMTSYASPVYYPDKQKTTTVTQWNCQHKSTMDQSLAQQWSSVPIPSYAIAAGGTDTEMSVYDYSTDTLWDFWKARKRQGRWEACWGGRILNASQSDGVFNQYYGATATSLPFIGGQITAEELSAGEIRHVIGISMVDVEDKKIFSWPAHRSDGVNPLNAPNRIPEGQRFRLDPSVNVDDLSMHPIGKIIAKAAQKYGFVVWDKAGAISMRAQNPYSYTAKGLPNPYLALFADTKGYAIMNGFPWDKLQFLPMNYGQPQ